LGPLGRISPSSRQEKLKLAAEQLLELNSVQFKSFGRKAPAAEPLQAPSRPFASFAIFA
jgi:hypothetical protein